MTTTFPPFVLPFAATGTPTFRTQQDHAADRVSVFDFGAKGDGTTDDTAAFALALASARLSAKSHLFIPAGTWNISAALNVTIANLRIEGAGKQATILMMNNGSSNIINWSGFNGQMDGITLAYSGTPARDAIALNTTSYGGQFWNLHVFNVGIGIKCSDTGRAQTFSQFSVYSFSGSAIWVADVNDVFINEFVLFAGGTEGDSTVGQDGVIRITGDVEAFTASQGDAILGKHGLIASSTTPGRGTSPAFCNFSQIYFDSSANDQVRLTNTILFNFVNCWFAGGRTTGAAAPGCQTTNCVDTTFVACEFIDNGNHGLVLNTGTVGTRVIGCTFDSNGAKVPVGTANGITVIGGVTDFVISGCNFSNGIIPVGAGGGQQGCAVRVLPGSSDRYQITGNLVAGNYNSQSILDYGTGQNKSLIDNFGDPLGYNIFSENSTGLLRFNGKQASVSGYSFETDDGIERTRITSAGAHITGQLAVSAGLGVFGRGAPTAQPSVSGSRAGNAALGSLLTALGATGIILDGSSGTLSPQEYGYIGDGASHPASSKFASLAAAQAVYPSCLSLTDEIDGLAIQTALTNLAGVGAAAELLLPAGCGRISRSLTVTLTGNTALSIHGTGSDVSELLFIGDTDGIVVTYASSASFTRDTTTGAALKVNGISVIRGPATTGKDGIRIIGDSANASGTIQPDTVFNDVVARGGANGGGWTNCIVAQDVANTSWFHVLCQGPFTASAISSPTRGTGTAGVVIKTTGSRYATQHNFSHCTFNVLGRGLDIYERIQGVAVANCNFTGGLNGIYWNSNGRQEQLAVSNSQFSTLQTGIYCFNMQNIAVNTCVFYNQNSYVPAASANTWYGLKLDEIDNCAITGCNFMGSNPAQTIALEFGIAITNDTVQVAVDTPSVIAGNTFYNLHGQALYTRNNTTNILFTSNAVDHISGFPVIVADPGTTPICTSNMFNNAPFLSGFPGSGATQLYELTHGAGPFTIAGAVDVRGPVLFAPYTFATLPAVDTWVGHTIRITDRSQRLATSDGANWRFGDGMIVT